MPSPILTRKINSSRIVWFASSNRWIYLEEPAWYVLTLIRKSLPAETIAKRCSFRYPLPFKDSLKFVSDIASAISKMEKPLKMDADQILSPETINSLHFIPYSTRCYKIKNKYISFSFGSRTAEYYIHPPLAHLEINSSELPESNAHFDIFEHEGIPMIRREDFPEVSDSAENFIKLKKKLFIELVNIMYKKNTGHWMSFLHASGVSNGKKSILLSSASGSGKSTMAALLQAKGHSLVSDDFIPLDASTKRAWPFPAAISVKQGSFHVLTPYYGNLNDKNYNLYPFTHSSVRYLHTPVATPQQLKPLPVNTIIFIQYNPKVGCSLTPLSIPDALKLFHDQAWVSHNPDYARSFINWFMKLKCWKLEYSDNEKGIEVIKEIFLKEG